MADNVETLGNFSNPIVPKAPRVNAEENLANIQKAGERVAQSTKDLGTAEAEFGIKKAARLSEEATRQSDLGMAEVANTRKAFAAVAQPEFKPSQETFIGMSSLAGLIAFVGSAMGQQGRQSGKAAIDSMTGMMKGYQTGRQDVFRREQIEFDKNIQTMKAMNDKLLKDLTLAQEEMKFNFSKGQANAAVAIAGYAGPVTKATFENQGIGKTLTTTTELSKGLINIEKMYAEIGLKNATLAQNLAIAQMKAAGGAAGKLLKPKEIKEIAGPLSLANSLDQLAKDFKPEYANLGAYGFGADYSLAAKRKGLPGFDTKADQDAVSWWSRYQQLQAPGRHDLFGATLTGGELVNFQSFTSIPGNSAPNIKTNLFNQAKFARDTSNEKAQNFERFGYNVANIPNIDFEKTRGDGSKFNQNNVGTNIPTFSSEAEAQTALDNGTIKAGDTVKIGSKRMIAE